MKIRLIFLLQDQYDKSIRPWNGNIKMATSKSHPLKDRSIFNKPKNSSHHPVLYGPYKTRTEKWAGSLLPF